MINWERRFFICMLLVSGVVLADPAAEGRALGESLHQKGYTDASPNLQEIQQSLMQNPEQAAFVSENNKASSSFEAHFDGGRKGEDPLKSSLGTQHAESTPTISQPTLNETENFLKQKHRFSIAESDPILNPEPLIKKMLSEHPIDPEGTILKSPAQETIPAKNKIVKCRKTLPNRVATCTRKLIIRSEAGPMIDRNVSFTLRLAPHAYGRFHIWASLKNGTYRVQAHHGDEQSTAFVPDWASIQFNTLLNNHTARYWEPNYFHLSTSSSGCCCWPGTRFKPDAGNQYSTYFICDVGGNPLSWHGTFAWTFKEPTQQLLEYWEGCEDLEAEQQSGSCSLVESEQGDLKATRNIAGYPQPVTRDYWSETRTYLCGVDTEIDECEVLSQAGCIQIDSRCSVFQGNECVEYDNTFECGAPNYAKGSALVLDQGMLGFVVPEEAASAGYEAGDFGQGLSQFQALTEMAKQPMEDGLGGIDGDANNPSVFRGACKQCRVSAIPALFRDCCKLKGLLQNFLGGCNEEEKQLAIATLRKKRCVQAPGRYCHKKVLGVCLERRDSYCCYGSQLARIVQEIAHQHLGISFGTGEEPNCGALTAEQLSQIDFDTPYAREKLSEILVETQASAAQKFKAVEEAVSKLGPVSDKIKELEGDLAERSKDLKRLHSSQSSSAMPEVQP